MLKKFPFVKQEGIMDCGAASLLMTLKYYKGLMTLEQMRDITYTDQSGTTAFHLTKAAEKIGFTAKGVKCSISQLAKQNLPVIAHVTLANSYQHYIVIYRVNLKKQTLIIADPADKIKKISFGEFNLIWNQIIISLTPQKQMPKFTNKTPMTIIKLLKTIKKETKLMIPLALFVTLFSIINTYYFKFIIDALTNNQPKNFLLFIFIIFIFINLLNLATDYCKNKLLIHVKQRIDAIISYNTFSNIISLPYKYYCSRTTGEIISRINDLNIVKNLIASVLFVMFIDLPITLIAMLFLYSLSSQLFFITMIIYICYLLILLFFRQTYQVKINQLQEERGNLNSKAVEYISSYETIKGLFLEKTFLQKILDDNYKLIATTKQFDFIQNNQNVLKQMLASFGFLIIIYYGSLLVIEGGMTIGSLVTYNMLLTYFLDPVKNLLELDINYKEMKNALKRISALFSNKETSGYIKKSISGDIIIKNLSHSYDEIHPVLKNINLTIKTGEKVLFYGASGSGKSTLLKLLMTYFKVERNKIFYNQIDINDYQKVSFNNGITYISQKEKTFNDTVLNNLAITNNNLTAIKQMSSICEVDSFLDKNLGMNMMIEENAYNLSGGEKQRIVLARSLLKKANIILIDEGFSEMDVALERRILKKIFTKFKQKTFIIVTHRLDNQNLFDKTFYFKKGQLVNG